MIAPWDLEPRGPIEWNDEATGYQCVARRGGSGAWCGYVAVPEDHPAFGLDYEDPLVVDIDVHGGLTYSGERGFGFDCAHYGDLVPSLWKYFGAYGGEYRDLDYVKAEVSNLARQLAALVAR